MSIPPVLKIPKHYFIKDKIPFKQRSGFQNT